MASIYARGRKLWCRLKEDGAWVSKSTPFYVGDEASAKRYAMAAQKIIDSRRGGVEQHGPITVAAYARKWIQERRERGIRSTGDDEVRLDRYALPHIGKLSMFEVRPRHIRDMVRALRAAGKIAPRSIRGVYALVGTMFRDAVADEIIAAHPCVLKRGELPSLVDADPEWRAQATYSIAEVEQLISDPVVAVERRVLYALKAIAGLRHGEAAALRWRHYDRLAEPLGRLTVAISYDSRRQKEKQTKTGVTRRVPVHPALATILAVWRLNRWEQVYGRQATEEDLIVPARTFRPINAADVGHAMKDDLSRLGLRVEAGSRRSRGGHDLRAWFITTCQEHGAHRDLLRVVTHTATGDIVSGYTRATWGALCGEVAKLRISADSRGEVLELATGFATDERARGNRWRKMATPTGFESLSQVRNASTMTRT